MKIKIKYCLPGLLFSAALLFSSCQKISSGTDTNYAVVTLATGVTYTFELPPNDGSDDIYAVRTTSSGSSAVKAYTVSAIDASDVPYNAFYLKLIPAYTDSNGDTVGPTAVVRVTTYSTSTSSTQIDSNYYPKSRTFDISSSNELSSSNYNTPVGSGGKFEFNWTVDTDNEVAANETYSEYTYKSYSVVSVKVLATVK
jgi:hypothetical protein